MANNQDTLKRAYASLLSLKKNLPNDHPNNLMDESYVDIYNEQLSKLESVNIDVSDFRIPDNMLERRLTTHNTRTGVSTYSKGRYVPTGYFHTRLDSLLTYFDLSQENDKTEIGFHS
ncbi:MAG TPA: hypothetical protein VGF75_03405 [Candidatus Saccharimonadales bacterium]